MKKINKKSAIIICMVLMAVSLSAVRLTSMHQTVSVLQTRNVEALTDGDIDWWDVINHPGKYGIRFAIQFGVRFAYAIEEARNTVFCRCHSSSNSCMSGNMVSFRKYCYKGLTDVNCSDFGPNCED